MHMPLDAEISWATLAKRTLKETVQDNCFGMAAAARVPLFLSLFPALLIVVALTSFFPRPAGQHPAWVGIFTPPEVSRSCVVRFNRFPGAATRVSDVRSVGRAVSSSSAMSAIVDTVNRAYGVKEERPWWKIQALAISWP